MKFATKPAPVFRPRSGRATLSASVWIAGIAAIALVATIFLVGQRGGIDLLPRRPATSERATPAPIKLAQLNDTQGPTVPPAAVTPPTVTPPATVTDAAAAAAASPQQPATAAGAPSPPTNQLTVPVTAEPATSAETPAAAVLGPPPEPRGPLPMRTDLIAPGVPAPAAPSTASVASPARAPTATQNLPTGSPPPADKPAPANRNG